MLYDTEEAIKDYFVPVILGNGKAAFLLSHRIFRKTGILSYICGEKFRAVNLCNPFGRFFRTAPYSNAELLLEQLRYFSRRMSCRLPLLIACGKEYADFVETNRDLLENYYLVCDKNSVFGIFPAKN